jgi:nitrate/TMAO reductase-like tetraheme cytochrome c subunit
MTQPTPPESEAAPVASAAEELPTLQPAPARPRRKRWPFILAALAALSFLLVFFIASTEFLHWTESTAFCSLCHVMKPEYTAYHNSSHARAECGTCHIGPGAIPAIQAKLANARYLWVYPLNLYERPIPSPIHSLRPVEVVCEQCHWPEKHYTDRLVVKNQYATDEENSLTQVAFNVRTGGGRENEGQGRGIHWHIANPVYYIATDERLQEIPWVSVEYDGVVTEYLSVDSNLTPDALSKYEKRKMDCVDCHNRASHDFERPGEVADRAIAQGVLPDLPFIKQQAVAVLETQYATEEEGAAAVAGVEDFYKNEHPDVYAAREADVKTAVSVLQEMFDRTQFPFMNVTWQSHPNNVGHSDFPGCFRCHDGKHLSSDNQAIRLECNLCHTIPQVAGPGQVLQPIAAVAAGNEPDSHRSTTWLAEHRFRFDASCEACHTTDNPGGSDNTSFCANSACHATEWTYVGLNAPQIRELSAPPRQPGTGVPNPIPHPVNATTDCTVCHGPEAVHPFPANHASFTVDMCAGCHTSSQTSGETGGEQPAVDAPAIPHQLQGMGDCAICHGLDAMKPFPETHTSFTVDQCANCHQPAEGVTEPGAASTPEATPEATPDATSTPADGVAAAPVIPHDLAGRDDCLACHAPSGGLKPAPADHVGRANDSCQACHRPQS